MKIDRRGFVTGGAAAVLCMTAQAKPGLAQPDACDEEKPSASELVAIRQAAQEFMRRWQVPGLGVAISRHGHVVYRDAFGAADMQSHERLTAEHRFRIASVSKPITAVAVFTLIAQGALRLSDRVFGVNGILGDAFELPTGSTWLDEITVEHLLTHTAGGWTNDRDDPMFREPQLDHAALIAWTIKHQPLKTRPGTTYAYSNFGYCLLGRAIEKITARPYETYVRDSVLRPAGIQDMSIAGNTLAERQSREVRYYGMGRGNPYAMNVRRMDSHGGWLATPTDLASFANHVDGFSTGSILKPETIRTMTAPSKANPHYAMGWEVNSAGNWWHTGSLDGTASILVRTRTRFCWAALVNTGAGKSPITDDLDRLMWAIVRRVPRWGA